MADIRSFGDLRSWQEAQELISSVYSATSSFPKEEVFGLTSQIRRAAVSIPTNIAEGMGRGSVKDLIRFLIIARGSTQEVLSLLVTAKNLNFLDEEEYLNIRNRYNGLAIGINAHISSLSVYK